MYICICNAVTEREIHHAVELGCDSYDKLSRDLGVGTCCGKCKKEASRVVNEHVAELRVEARAAMDVSNGCVLSPAM
jgi:bacterioferritin-associated ferredoxin